MAAPVMTRHQGNDVEALGLGPSRRGLRLAEGPLQSKPVQQLAYGDLVCFNPDWPWCQKTPMLFLYGIQARPGKGGCGMSGSTESDFAKSLKPLQVATAVVYIQTGWEDEELVGSTYLVDPTHLASWPAVATSETKCARSPPMQPVKHVPPSLSPRLEAHMYTGLLASTFPRRTRRGECRAPPRTKIESLQPLSATSQ